MVLYLRVTPALKLISDKHLSKEAKPVAFLYANVKLAKKKKSGDKSHLIYNNFKKTPRNIPNKGGERLLQEKLYIH